MAKNRKRATFSTHRLGGEPVPEDVAILLEHADELAERTGVELNGTRDWAPWNDTSHLSASDRANLDIMANVRAIAEVCARIAFIAAHEDHDYFGYWRGPAGRPVAESPLVLLDNEGQFSFCGGTSFAEALLAYRTSQFADLRDWLVSLGVPVAVGSPAELTHPEEPSPDELHEELYYRYRREAGLSDPRRGDPEK